MNFIPSTEAEKKLLLKEIGIGSVNGLFKDIPQSVLVKELEISKPLTEMQVKDKLTSMSMKNNVCFKSFLGAGSYNHFIPSVVNHIVSRSEFYTAYTPYQPEISQGILQAIFEYQSMICSLTGQDVTNASMYDGASAMAEACIMASSISRKKEIVILKSVHPDYLKVVKTYCDAYSLDVKEVDEVEFSSETAAVVVQSPDFFGRIHDCSKVKEKVGDVLLVWGVVEPTSLFILKEPSLADIVVGEGHSFGNAMNFGGPYLGIMATKDRYKRLLPGRIVGQTVDTDGKTGYILTLQAREQHIRREKACSNICSNEALCALAATVYLSYLGKSGENLGDVCLQKAHYLYSKLLSKGFSPVFDAPFYNEFVVKVD
ncbi:MAG: aminomethyl-transferring glycine dehydrogenase subunit GcvPA, partial [Nanoarchaeota archaeon]|nr:aminomethyl-transferring glycine dehydrogenase subunit GcvPA [Nanoarchaeota archaeon]